MPFLFPVLPNPTDLTENPAPLTARSAQPVVFPCRMSVSSDPCFWSDGRRSPLCQAQSTRGVGLMKTTPAGADASASAEAQPPAGVDGCPTGGPGACADGREGARRAGPGRGGAGAVRAQARRDEQDRSPGRDDAAAGDGAPGQPRGARRRRRLRLQPVIFRSHTTWTDYGADRHRTVMPNDITP